jgi:hypothetical protein
MFPISGEEVGDTCLLGPLDKANLSHNPKTSNSEYLITILQFLLVWTCRMQRMKECTQQNM